MSQKSQQMCECCGWSKVTTYQGLRVHQGKMGCTPKGLRISPSQQQHYAALYASSSQPDDSWSPPSSSKDAYSLYGSQGSLFQPSSASQYSIQEPTYSRPARAEVRDEARPKSAPPELVFSTRAKTQEEKTCHCGWSKVTSYQGLRIHQGRMGCTPKGLGLPQNLQHLFNSTAPKDELPLENPREKRRSVVRAAVSVKGVSEELEKTENRRTMTDRPQKDKPPITRPKPVLKSKPESTPVSREAQIKQKEDSCFETPEQRRLSTVEGSRTRRTLDFSSRENQVMENTTKASTQLQIQSRKLQMYDVESSAKNLTIDLDKEWLEINSVFSEVFGIVENARQKELKPLENRKEKLECKANNLIQNLQEEIEDFESVLDHTNITKAFNRLLTPVESKNEPLAASFSFGSLQTTLSVMMKQIQLRLDKLSAVELKRFTSYAVNVKFDPTSAQHWPAVSDDDKKIQDGGQRQQIFMAREGFLSGRSYWEVQVGGKSGWDLGVALDKANRKGKLTLSPENGYWAIVHFEGDKYAALTAPPVCVELKRKPQTVGVFLDYDEGLVSFYDVDNQTHIHSFTQCSFNDALFPFFRISVKY